MNLKTYSTSDFPSYLPKLNNLYDDLFMGGKGFRARLIQMIAIPLSLDEKSLHLLSQTIEFIHNASLLHDDLVDRSHLRRGKPTAWLKYSPEYAVLAGDYLLARVMMNLSSYGNIQLVQYTSKVISDLLEGEWLQDAAVGNATIQLEQLDRIHHLKTSSLFQWCLRAPFIAQQRYEPALHEVLEKIGSILGLLFQRSDDLLDFNIRNEEGKAILGDLKFGYLNSFGAWICRDQSQESMAQIMKSETIEDFISRVGGNEVFDAALKGFDEMNEKLIVEYHNLLKDLMLLIKPEEKDLPLHLSALPDFLYWRKLI